MLECEFAYVILAQQSVSNGMKPCQQCRYSCSASKSEDRQLYTAKRS